MNFFSTRRRSNAGTGFGQILAQGLTICLLLLANGAIVRTMVNLDWTEEVRISQAIQLIVPVAMIFVELWLLDFLFASTTRHDT